MCEANWRSLAVPPPQAHTALETNFSDKRVGIDVRLGSRLCENSNARRARRNILVEFRTTKN